MEALQFVILFEDFQTQSGRIFIDELETAFEIEGIVEDKLKKFLFKLKLRGLPSEWHEIIRDDYEEYNKLKWVDVKKKFLSTSNLFCNDDMRVESYNDIKECFIEENNQANECQVNDQYCIIENKEENSGDLVKESNEYFIVNSRKSDLYVENVENNQLIDEENLYSNDDGEISVEVNYVEKDLWKLNQKEILSYEEEERIQSAEFQIEVHIKGTSNENNSLKIMIFGYEFNNERHIFIQIVKKKGTKWKLFYFYFILIRSSSIICYSSCRSRSFSNKSEGSSHRNISNSYSNSNKSLI
jgi:hypothetical protein